MEVVLLLYDSYTGGAAQAGYAKAKRCTRIPPRRLPLATTTDDRRRRRPATPLTLPWIRPLLPRAYPHPASAPGGARRSRRRRPSPSPASPSRRGRPRPRPCRGTPRSRCCSQSPCRRQTTNNPASQFRQHSRPGPSPEKRWGTDQITNELQARGETARSTRTKRTRATP